MSFPLKGNRKQENGERRFGREAGGRREGGSDLLLQIENKDYSRIFLEKLGERKSAKAVAWL